MQYMQKSLVITHIKFSSYSQKTSNKENHGHTRIEAFSYYGVLPLGLAEQTSQYTEPELTLPLHSEISSFHIMVLYALSL